MCIRRETQEKARQSLAFSPVSKHHKHITYMLRQCTSIVYLPGTVMGLCIAVLLVKREGEITKVGHICLASDCIGHY
jgi:hypothetical protein